MIYGWAYINGLNGQQIIYKGEELNAKLADDDIRGDVW